MILTMPENTRKQKKETKEDVSDSKTSKATKSTSKSPKNTESSRVSKPKNGSSKTRRTGKDKQDKNVRYFKLINIKSGKTNGRYTGDTPKQAASKAYTKMVQKYKKDKKNLPKTSEIYLRESTRGSLKKIYGYQARRDKLDEPQKLVIHGDDENPTKTITYHFRNKIRKVKVPEDVSKIVANRKKASNMAKGGSKSASKSKNSKSSPKQKTAKSGSKAATKSKTAKSSKTSKPLKSSK